MSFAIIQKHTTANSRAIKALLFFVSVLAALTMMQDAVEAYFRQSGFYVSESFLFSSFWWLFAPFLYVQYTAVRSKQFLSASQNFVLIAVPIVAHLLMFPLLVWLLSELFYEHTFYIWQTLQYALSAHVYQLILLYTFPFLLYKKFGKKEIIVPAKSEPKSILVRTYLSSIIVASANAHTVVAVSDILYITASSPYVMLHTGNRKYLHSETLASLIKQLDENVFVRIHKSTIVNIQEVTSYTSRLNGDYDIIMQDNHTLRLSRNYVARFKEVFGKR